MRSQNFPATRKQNMSSTVMAFQLISSFTINKADHVLPNKTFLNFLFQIMQYAFSDFFNIDYIINIFLNLNLSCITDLPSWIRIEGAFVQNNNIKPIIDFILHYFNYRGI